MPVCGGGRHWRKRAAGHYRVILTGFSVRSQTWDHVLEADGKGDEVFVKAVNTRITSAGRAIYESDVTSQVMGEKIHANWVQAGSR